MRGPTVLVLWVGRRPGPWTLRSLAAAGYRLVAAHPEGAAGGRSRVSARPLRYPSPTERPDDFLECVAGICVARAVDCVLPLDEDIVRLLADRAPDLGGAVVSGPDAAQYRDLCDKGALGDTARALGIDHPATVEVAPGDGAEGWPPLPCIIKPRVSRSHGSPVRVRAVADLAEREAAIRELAAAATPALVQERLSGPRWVGHCVRGPLGLELIAFRALRDFPRGEGPASVMVGARPPPGLVEATERLLASVGYLGPCGLSFIERDGGLAVHDVNLRLGATVAASIASGFDLPCRAVEIALGMPPSRPSRPWRPVTYVRLDGELRALGAALGGRGGEPAREIAGRIGAALLARDAVLDPSPLDMGWAPGFAAGLLGGALRRAGSAARRRRP